MSGVTRVPRTSAAGVGFKWPKLQCRIPDADELAVTETWLQPEEGGNELMAREYSTFRMDGWGGRIECGKLILVAEKYAAQKGRWRC